MQPKGASGSAAPEGEPRPMLKKQGDATDGGTLTASEGSQRLCCTGRGAPSATERAAQLEMTDGGVTLRPKGAVGLLHRKGSPVRR